MPFWHRCCQESSLKRGLVQPLYALHSRDDVRGQSAALRDCGAGKPRWSKTRLVRKTSIKIDILIDVLRTSRVLLHLGFPAPQSRKAALWPRTSSRLCNAYNG